MLFEPLEKRFELRRERHLQLERFPRGWMLKLKAFGVQKVSPEPQPVPIVFAPGASLLGELARGSVERVADDGVTEGGHVHTDLVRASGLDAYANQGELAEGGCEPPQHFIVRDGAARVFGSADGHAGAANGIAPDGRIDGSASAWQVTLDQGNVSLVDAAGRKHLRQSGVRGVVFGNDDEPAGVFVEAMHYAGAQVAAGG